MKQKVIDILNDRSSEINQSEFTQWGVIEENFETVAEEIVKLFAIPVVSGSCGIKQCSDSEGITDCGNRYAPKTGMKYCPFCGRPRNYR